MYIIYDDLYLSHENGPGHPENPGRLMSIKNKLFSSGISEELDIQKPYRASTDDILLIHDVEYIKEVQGLSKEGGLNYLDPDTGVTSDTYDCAMLAAGGCMKGIDLICSEERTGPKCFFALVRPPGHHAFSDRGSGFCIFNNIAIATRYAQEKYSLGKVAIIDFDAHHGNGTQELFYSDGSVFYISFHQYPHYPGSGYYDEVGVDGGKGATMNFPFSQGTGQKDYLYSFRDLVIPVLNDYSPDLVLISAGYDSHSLDMLSSLELTKESYYYFTYIAGLIAAKSSSGRMGIILEGGYDYDATSASVVTTVEACMELEKSKAPDIDIDDILKRYGEDSGLSIENKETIENLKKIFS